MAEQSSIERIADSPQNGSQSIALRDVTWAQTDMTVLYALLAERRPEQSISHKRMPTWEEHVSFMHSAPYRYWYFIDVECTAVGSIYLTRQREIGLSIFREYQRKGYGRAAVQELMRMHPGKFLANVNLANEASRKLWESLGGKVLQVTYAL